MILYVLRSRHLYIIIEICSTSTHCMMQLNRISIYNRCIALSGSTVTIPLAFRIIRLIYPISLSFCSPTMRYRLLFIAKIATKGSYHTTKCSRPHSIFAVCRNRTTVVREPRQNRENMQRACRDRRCRERRPPPLQRR